MLLWVASTIEKMSKTDKSKMTKEQRRGFDRHKPLVDEVAS